MIRLLFFLFLGWWKAAAIGASVTDVIENGMIHDGTEIISKATRTSKIIQPAPKIGAIEPRIVGGEDAQPGEFPFFVKSNAELGCGASLIHPDIVLTAAHCQGFFGDGVIVSAYDFDPSSSRGGAVQRQVDLQYRHHGYNYDPDLWKDDIMILRLTELVIDVAPVVLNRDPDVPSEDSETLTGLGFGYTSLNWTLPSALKKVDLSYIPRQECEEIFSEVDYVQTGEGIMW